MKKLHTIDKIFILCNKENEKDRYEKWQNWTKNRSDIEFFSYRWAHELSDSDIEQYYIRDKNIEDFEGRFRSFPLNKAEISSGINWIKMLEEIKSQNLNRVLVLESDVYFDEYFEDDFNRAIKILNGIPEDQWDMLSIGAGAGQRVNFNNGMFLSGIFKVDGVRTIDALVFSKNGLNKTISLCNKITMPYDIEIAYKVKDGSLNMFWLDPPIARQGSVDGIYDSYLNQGQFNLLNNKKYGEK
jgi:hypothetical protein